ncbi:MAG: zinc-ribbon and DUF3426 domain-containing protein [Methylococcales bacterium]|nr:zinc-ribbon and DUF3426 domain-containing protein [Methylococcales bacterium]
MYTQCPKCETIQPISLAKIRKGRGMIQCNHCASLFDALERLSETTVINLSEQQQANSLPWQEDKDSSPVDWRVGLIVGSLLLVAQLIYFEGHGLSQNPSTRPALMTFCQLVGSHLPTYRNLNEFVVLQGSFTPLPNQNYTFKLVFSNQAVFPQAYPSIKLSLQDYNGIEFANRIFSPQDYLSENEAANLMAADATTEVSLDIAAPKSSIGGSTFDLIY